jgi:hypothetical protein
VIASTEGVWEDLLWLQVNLTALLCGLAIAAAVYFSDGQVLWAGRLLVQHHGPALEISA